jgi:hypothetical protein
MADSSNGNRPPRGLRRDIHQARAGATASAEELREFVAQLRGRSPQEMLGMIAASNLVRATIQATVITVVFLAVFTVGPYAYSKMVKKDQPSAAPAAAPAAPAAKAPAPGPSAVAGPGGIPPVGAVPPGGLPPSVAPGASGPRDPLSPLGVNEARSTDPDKNPLLNKNDDLLKDIGK